MSDTYNDPLATKSTSAEKVDDLNKEPIEIHRDKDLNLDQDKEKTLVCFEVTKEDLANKNFKEDFINKDFCREKDFNREKKDLNLEQDWKKTRF